MYTHTHTLTHRATSSLGNSLEILWLNSAHRDGSRLYEVLQAQVVDALSREDDLRTYISRVSE
jgi:hypothetical protein